MRYRESQGNPSAARAADQDCRVHTQELKQSLQCVDIGIGNAGGWRGAIALPVIFDDRVVASEFRKLAIKNAAVQNAVMQKDYRVPLAGRFEANPIAADIGQARPCADPPFDLLRGIGRECHLPVVDIYSA